MRHSDHQNMSVAGNDSIVVTGSFEYPNRSVSSIAVDAFQSFVYFDLAALRSLRHLLSYFKERSFSIVCPRHLWRFNACVLSLSGGGDMK